MRRTGGCGEVSSFGDVLGLRNLKKKMFVVVEAVLRPVYPYWIFELIELPASLLPARKDTRVVDNNHLTIR
jgi:hypothetical protein